MSRALPESRGVPYRRGAVMGLTMAEAFVLIAFALLLLLGLWSVERDATDARLAPLASLTPDEVEAARSLAATGRIEALAALPVDARKLPEGEVWRLVDGAAEARLLDGVASLPEAMKADLASLVEIADPAALQSALAAAALAAAAPDDPLAPVTTAAARLSPEALAALATLLADPQAAERVLLDPDADPLAGVARRLAAARLAQGSMVADLRGTLGATVAAIGGTIEADGSIVLPDTVLFEQGRARITPVMRGFLAEACAPWLAVLRDSGADVARAQIEGHASSEWRTGSGPDEAYLNNLALSQARSQVVLNACLAEVADPSLRAWAQRHLAAVGYSSARPVMAGATEDPARSRRVVFSVGLDDGGLLRAVEGDVAAGLATR